MKAINLGKATIGDSSPVFVIAEAGVNHNGNLDLAHELIDAAAAAGANAIKFQTFKTDDVVTEDAPKAEYQEEATGDGGSQHDMISKLELGPEAFSALAKHADEKDLIFLSTPFDVGSVDVLESLDVPAFKVPSGEITNPVLLAHIASKGKPILMSTGMANLDEVKEAVRRLTEAGSNEIALFQCTSNYPTKPEDVNLRVMDTFRKEFDVPVGLSDHTQGIEISVAAVAMGAKMIEKHLTLDNNMEGPDHKASMEPKDFKALVSGIRKVEAALGSGVKEPCTAETEVAKVARRSLVAKERLPQGTVIEADHIVFKRPGTGISPMHMDTVLGKKLKQNVERGQLISLEHFS